MTLADLFTGWSAALAVWCAGGNALAMHRLCDAWSTLTARDRVFIVGIIAGGFSGAIHQGDSAWLWMHDAYSAANLRFSTWGYRISATVMALALGGAVAWPRCGHRGWIGLLLVGLVAGGVAVGVS